MPCDSVEAERATVHCLLEVNGPCYIRFAREATPVVTTPAAPYCFGRANVIRYRGEQARFHDSFEHILADQYEGEKEDACIVACWPMVPEAIRAA